MKDILVEITTIKNIVEIIIKEVVLVKLEMSLKLSLN